ncbi:hypothetical protein, partial [Stenotrophomonas maltophilia]
RGKRCQPNSGRVTFNKGAAAFDAAVCRASAHHRRTGQGTTVRVEALGNSVDAVHFEALAIASGPVIGLHPAPVA